jgi:hypothetical protein
LQNVLMNTPQMSKLESEKKPPFSSWVKAGSGENGVLKAHKLGGPTEPSEKVG